MASASGLSLDHGVDRRPVLVDFVDAREIFLRDRARGVFAELHARLQFRDRDFVQIEGLYGTGDGDSD